MVRVLTEPKNSLVKQYQALFKMDDVDLASIMMPWLRLPESPSNVRQVREDCVRSWRTS